MCMWWGEGVEKGGTSFLENPEGSIATQRKIRWQFKGLEKDDFITRNFQPESNFK